MRQPILFPLLLIAFNPSLSFGSEATKDSQRIVTAMNLKNSSKPDNAGPKFFQCVDQLWPDKSKRIVAAFTKAFSPAELSALANFFESPAGRKWNKRSAVQIDNTTHPFRAPLPLPYYANGEENTVATFLASPVGRKFMSSPEIKTVSHEIFLVNFELGRDCYVKHDS